MLARGSDLEHLGTALGAFALGRGTAVLHRNLDGVFDLTLRLALDAIGFCCHLWILQSKGWYRAGPGMNCGSPYSGEAPGLLVRGPWMSRTPVVKDRRWNAPGKK